MGAGAALLYAGTEPERVTALVAVDALGPPDTDPASAPERFTAWLEDLERVGARGRRAPATGDLVARLRERSPRFSEDVARHMAGHGTRQENGERLWKFDPLHQTRAPQPYYVAQARAFWNRIRCPVLYVEGTESPYRLDPADLADRLTALRARRIAMEGVGHHPHLEQPDRFASLVTTFLDDTEAAVR
jgi:pimeloyl-ACP methyl ester carboxylesterase